MLRSAVSPNRVLKVAGILAAACMAIPAPAFASQDTSLVPLGPGSANPLDPTPLSSTQTLGTSSTLPSNEIFSCNKPYAWVASAPSGYVLGSCLSGVHFHRLSQTTLADGSLWNGGQVFGNYSGCGWILQSFNSPTGSTGTNTCVSGSIGYNPNEFSIYNNNGAAAAGGQAALDCNTQQGKCTDGSSVRVKTSCKVYANFRPWASGQSLKDPIVGPTGSPLQTGMLPVDTYVKWRYVAKYQSSSGIGYVMIKVPGITSGYGNWGFINISCLATPLPYVTAV